MRRESASPAGRVRLALELFAAGEAMMRQTLRRSRPEASEAEIEAEVASWLAHRPGAEAGDSAGRAVPWPRPRG